jgi:hypothetical protein
MWALVHPSHLRLCWWVKGRPLYFVPISWVPLQKKMYYILLLVYKCDECQHLFLFIEFQQDVKNLPTKFARFCKTQNPTTFAFWRRDQMQSSLFSCTHFQNTFSTWKVQTSFFGPHICCWYISFSRFTGLGTRATFVGDPSSLCKIKLCWHSPKKKGQKQCDRPNPLLD